MKKHYIMLTILLCFCYLLYGCSNLTANETPSPSISPTPLIDPSPKPSTNPAVTIHPVYGELPVYQPGSIILEDRNNDDYNFERKYRIAYYTIVGKFWGLLDEEELEDFYEWAEDSSEETNYGEHRDEMKLVSFVKRYNITREEFDSVVEKLIEEGGDSEVHEEYEVPNADIIYTFDNEIINEYYRYE